MYVKNDIKIEMNDLTLHSITEPHVHLDTFPLTMVDMISVQTDIIMTIKHIHDNHVIKHA